MAKQYGKLKRERGEELATDTPGATEAELDQRSDGTMEMQVGGLARELASVKAQTALLQAQITSLTSMTTNLVPILGSLQLSHAAQSQTLDQIKNPSAIKKRPRRPRSKTTNPA